MFRPSLIFSFGFIICVATPPRLPSPPNAFFIWSTKAEAVRWRDENPSVCITKVPDGYATQECP